MKAINLTPRFWVAASLVIFTLVVGLIGPFVVGTDPDAVIGGLYDKPAGGLPMLLGTDNEGQSVMANLVYGTRTSLLVGLVAGLIASVIGLVLGLVAGYQGGWLDDVISGLTNVALAIPSIVLVILLGIALNDRSSLALAFIIGITSWPWMARAVRAQSTSIRSREHIDVARLSGASWFSILSRDVLPYLLSYVVMAFVLQVSGAILAEAALSLLGLGPSGTTSLGVMLYWALAWGSIRTGAWWAFLPPTVMLTLIAFSLLLLQSSLDEVFNPRLRRGKLAKRKTKGGQSLPAPASSQVPTPIGAAGIVESPVPASTGGTR
ncbi:peptide/nickel transport system permease protein [Friedmanniella luteola]|uniref:Peptide/nickel transport system permease protein n=1 Tax=Friedmanniella luteola TaxID=546871 RepID=A0A1H1YXY8_9ACTN|nr:ABC transporter permease [Friedmanniella luteola]SDT26222.1 peptide/nickel transport system permease protein [Friedmanniella luteola]